MFNSSSISDPNSEPLIDFDIEIAEDGGKECSKVGRGKHMRIVMVIYTCGAIVLDQLQNTLCARVFFVLEDFLCIDFEFRLFL